MAGIPVVHASVFRFEGQLTTFVPYAGPCYRCLHPTPPPPELAPGCSVTGVLGVVPGVMGLLQATEALKLLLGIGETLAGRLVLFDALEATFTELRFRRDPACPVCSATRPSGGRPRGPGRPAAEAGTRERGPGLPVPGASAGDHRLSRSRLRARRTRRALVRTPRTRPGADRAPGPARATLPVEIRRALVAHARAEYPNEACGLIAGTAAAAAGGSATRWHATRNRAASPLRYEVHPDDLLRVVLAIDDAGEAIWGIVHSPRPVARATVADRRGSRVLPGRALRAGLAERRTRPTRSPARRASGPGGSSTGRSSRWRWIRRDATDRVGRGPTTRASPRLPPGRERLPRGSPPWACSRPPAARRPARRAAARGRSTASTGQFGSANTSAGVPSSTMRPARITTTRPNVSATNRMSWLIAMTVRPSAASAATIARTRAIAAQVLAGRRLVEDDDRRPHREDGRDRQELPARVAQVVRVLVGGTGQPDRLQRLSDPRSSSAPRIPRFRGPNATSARTLPGEDLAVGILEREADEPRKLGDMASPDARAVEPDLPLVGSKEPVEVANEGRLPAPVLADDRQGLAGCDREVDTVERPNATGVRVGDPPDVDRDHPASSAITGRSRRPFRRQRLPVPTGRGPGAAAPPRAPEARVAQHVDRGPLADDPALVDDDDTIREPSSRAVLCSTTRIAVRLSRTRRRSASPTSRVPCGSSWLVGSSRMRKSGPHREDRGERDELRLAARQPGRVAIRERGDPEGPEARFDSLDHRRERQAEIARAEGNLLEHGRGRPRELRLRVLKEDPARVGPARAAACRWSRARRSSPIR